MHGRSDQASSPSECPSVAIEARNGPFRLTLAPVISSIAREPGSLKAGHLSGEIGLLNCGPRSATVMALTDIPAFCAPEVDFPETEAGLSGNTRCDRRDGPSPLPFPPRAISWGPFAVHRLPPVRFRPGMRGGKGGAVVEAYAGLRGPVMPPGAINLFTATHISVGIGRV
jgi:hypothetical protein